MRLDKNIIIMVICGCLIVGMVIILIVLYKKGHFNKSKDGASEKEVSNSTKTQPTEEIKTEEKQSDTASETPKTKDTLDNEGSNAEKQDKSEALKKEPDEKKLEQDNEPKSLNENPNISDNGTQETTTPTNPVTSSETKKAEDINSNGTKDTTPQNTSENKNIADEKANDVKGSNIDKENNPQLQNQQEPTTTPNDLTSPGTENSNKNETSSPLSDQSKGDNNSSENDYESLDEGDNENKSDQNTSYYQLVKDYISNRSYFRRK